MGIFDLLNSIENTRSGGHSRAKEVRDREAAVAKWEREILENLTIEEVVTLGAGLDLADRIRREAVEAEESVEETNEAVGRNLESAEDIKRKLGLV